MNLAAARAWAEQNKKTIAVIGAAGVGGLALVKRNAKGDGAASPAADPEGIGSNYGLAPLPATGAVYDSSASDVYNALQPGLESVGREQAALRELMDKLTEQMQKAPVPVVGPPAKVLPKPVPAPAPAPKPAPKPAPARVYTVVKNDNLTKIAQRLGLPNWQTLYNRNRAVIGGNPHLIKPGQQLVY